MLLEVVEREVVVNQSTLKKFIRCSFRPVLRHLDNGKTVFGGDAAGRLYDENKAPKLGELFEGVIKQFATTPYQIGTDGNKKTINKLTVVAYAEENPMEIANAQLKRHRASVLGQDGNGTVKFEDVKADDTAKNSDPKPEAKPEGAKAEGAKANG